MSPPKGYTEVLTPGTCDCLMLSKHKHVFLVSVGSANSHDVMVFSSVPANPWLLAFFVLIKLFVGITQCWPRYPAPEKRVRYLGALLSELCSVRCLGAVPGRSHLKPFHYLRFLSQVRLRGLTTSLQIFLRASPGPKGPQRRERGIGLDYPWPWSWKCSSSNPSLMWGGLLKIFTLNGC